MVPLKRRLVSILKIEDAADNKAKRAADHAYQAQPVIAGSIARYLAVVRFKIVIRVLLFRHFKLDLAGKDILLEVFVHNSGHQIFSSVQGRFDWFYA